MEYTPRQNLNLQLIDKIIFGVADANTGINFASLSIKANFSINGLAANEELSTLATSAGEGVYQIQLNQPIVQDSFERHILAEITDNQGNVKRVDLRFFTSDLIFANGFE